MQWRQPRSTTHALAVSYAYITFDSQQIQNGLNSSTHGGNGSEAKFYDPLDTK